MIKSSVFSFLCLSSALLSGCVLPWSSGTSSSGSDNDEERGTIAPVPAPRSSGRSDGNTGSQSQSSMPNLFVAASEAVRQYSVEYDNTESTGYGYQMEKHLENLGTSSPAESSYAYKDMLAAVADAPLFIMGMATFSDASTYSYIENDSGQLVKYVSAVRNARPTTDPQFFTLQPIPMSESDRKLDIFTESAINRLPDPLVLIPIVGQEGGNVMPFKAKFSTMDVSDGNESLSKALEGCKICLPKELQNLDSLTTDQEKIEAVSRFINNGIFGSKVSGQKFLLPRARTDGRTAIYNYRGLGNPRSQHGKVLRRLALRAVPTNFGADIDPIYENFHVGNRDRQNKYRTLDHDGLKWGITGGTNDMLVAFRTRSIVVSVPSMLDASNKDFSLPKFTKAKYPGVLGKDSLTGGNDHEYLMILNAVDLSKWSNKPTFKVNIETPLLDRKNKAGKDKRDDSVIYTGTASFSIEKLSNLNLLQSFHNPAWMNAGGFISGTSVLDFSNFNDRRVALVEQRLRRPIFAESDGVAIGSSCKEFYEEGCVILPNDFLLLKDRTNQGGEFMGVSSSIISMKVMGYAVDELVLSVGTMLPYLRFESKPGNNEKASWAKPDEVKNMISRGSIPVQVSTRDKDKFFDYGYGLFNAYLARRYGQVYGLRDRTEARYLKDLKADRNGRDGILGDSPLILRYYDLYDLDHENQGRGERKLGRLVRAGGVSYLPWEIRGDLGKYIDHKSLGQEYVFTEMLKGIAASIPSFSDEADDDKKAAKKIESFKRELQRSHYIMGLLHEKSAISKALGDEFRYVGPKVPVENFDIKDVPWLVYKTTDQQGRSGLYDYLFIRNIYTLDLDKSPHVLKATTDKLEDYFKPFIDEGNKTDPAGSKKDETMRMLLEVVFPDLGETKKPWTNLFAKSESEVDGDPVENKDNDHNWILKVNTYNKRVEKLKRKMDTIVILPDTAKVGAARGNVDFPGKLLNKANMNGHLSGDEKESSLFILPLPYKGLTSDPDKILIVQKKYFDLASGDGKNHSLDGRNEGSQVQVALPVVSITFNQIINNRWFSDYARQSFAYINEDAVSPVSMQCNDSMWYWCISSFAGPYVIGANDWLNTLDDNDGKNKFLSVTSIAAGAVYVGTIANKLGSKFDSLNSAQIREALYLSALPIGRADPNGYIYPNKKYGRGMVHYGRAYAFIRSCLSASDSSAATSYSGMLCERSILDDWNNKKALADDPQGINAQFTVVDERELGKLRKELDRTLSAKSSGKNKKNLDSHISFLKKTIETLEDMQLAWEKSKSLKVISPKASGVVHSPSAIGIGMLHAVNDVPWVAQAKKKNWLTNVNLASYVDVDSSFMDDFLLARYPGKSLEFDIGKLKFSGGVGHKESSLFAVRDDSAIMNYSSGFRTGFSYEVFDKFFVNVGTQNFMEDKSTYKLNMNWFGLGKTIGVLDASVNFGHVAEKGGMLGGKTSGVFGQTNAKTWIGKFKASLNLNSNVAIEGDYLRGFSKWENADFMSGKLGLSQLGIALKVKMSDISTLGFSYQESLRADHSTMTLKNSYAMRGYIVTSSDTVDIIPPGQEKIYEIAWETKYSNESSFGLWGAAVSNSNHNPASPLQILVGARWAVNF